MVLHEENLTYAGDPGAVSPAISTRSENRRMFPSLPINDSGPRLRETRASDNKVTVAEA